MKMGGCGIDAQLKYYDDMDNGISSLPLNWFLPSNYKGTDRDTLWVLF